MLTHPLLPFVNCPDGLAQDILIGGHARVPMSGCRMTPHRISSERSVLHAGGNALLSCMFCDQTFDHQDNLGAHILTEHPTTFVEPNVLRVEARLKVPWEDLAPKLSSLLAKNAEVHSCIVCGQISQNASELESHMRKHKEYYTYCCSICGRRFREARFLKTHMKKHPKAGGKGKGPQEPEPPVTINGVVQEPASEPVVSLYKMCLACGFFFPDQDSLDEHSKVHIRQVESGVEQRLDGSAEPKEFFFGALKLKPSAPKSDLPVKTVRTIPQLNPFVTYQAWQLATKGKVAVGVNNPKGTGHGASTDDSASDKEEVKVILAKDQETPPKKKETGRERRPPQAQTPNKPRGSQIQKVQDRPTTCELCSKTFRTYHQLVLHSRVHKREKIVEESPFSSVEVQQPRAVLPASIKEALEETLALVEEGLDRSKPKSKECSDCGKSFKSSYYLTVHLRTHTGEKPYKCVYCDYAAAQKTSLKYHIQRHHKDLPLELLAPSPTEGKQGSDEENPESKCWGPASGSPEEKSDGVCGKLSNPLVPVKTEYIELSPTNEGLLTYPSSVHMEKVDIKTEYYDEPLNLSLAIPAKAEFKSVVVPISCSLCPYTSICPEVLIIHRRLVHKDNPDATEQNRFEGNTGRKRSTDCPPALDGKDVPLLGDRHCSRRTTSPPPPAEQPQKPLVNPANELMQAPAFPAPSVSAPVQDGVQQSMRKRKYVMDRMVPLDRAALSEMSYPAIGGSIWHSDAARLCLGTQFGSLPQVGHFSEPPNKRKRFLAPVDMRADSGEKPGVRATPMDGPNQMLMTGMSVRSMPQGTGLPAPSEALGAGLDSDWDMMNLLRPCTPSDLAALYHSMPTNPSHGGLAPPRTGGGTMLYQHLTGLPNLQRRDPAGSFPNHRYGSSEKSA